MRTVASSSSCAASMLFELVLPGAVLGTMTARRRPRRPALPAGLPGRGHRERQGRRGARRGLARWAHGARVARHLHRRDGARRARTGRMRDTFWTNFGCMPHRYLYESHGIRRGMWTLSWFMDLLGPEFAAAAAARGVSREELLEHGSARSVPAGSDGLMTVLDWLAPTDRPFRKGVMLGFDARHTRGARLPLDPRSDRADDEGPRRRDVRRTRHHARARSSISGGGAASPLVHADLRRRVRHPGVPHARAGRRKPRLPPSAPRSAPGVYPDFATAAARMEKPREAFVPRRRQRRGLPAA